jgi:hypothetical protein
MPLDGANDKSKTDRALNQAEQNEGYLFGDYTPCNENENFLIQLKEYISTTSKIFIIHQDIEKLNTLLNNLDSINYEITSETKESISKMLSSIEKFQFISSEITKEFSSVGGSSNALVNDCRIFINKIESDFKDLFKRIQSYKQEIELEIVNQRKNAIIILKTWLSKDANFPSNIVAQAISAINIKYDREQDSYSINRIKKIFENNNDKNNTKTMSFSFNIDPSTTDFWKGSKTISDLGLEGVDIPIGFRISMARKIKQTFRFISSNIGSGKKQELQFINIDNYYLKIVKLENYMLCLTLADYLESDHKIIRINYDVRNLNSVKYLDNVKYSLRNDKVTDDTLPRIEYIHDKERRKLNIFEKEFIKFVDVAKLLLIGKQLVSIINNIALSDTIVTNSELKWVRMDEKYVFTVEDNYNLIQYDELLVLSFLENMGKKFTPLLKIIKFKSPNEGELVLTHITKDKQKKEYAIKLEDINSELNSSKEGRKISSILEIGS